MKILFAGGGSAGHLTPIIAIVREIRRIYQKSDLEFHFIGPKDEFGEILLSQEGIKIKQIISGKIRRYFTWKTILQNISDILFKIPVGILQSFFYIFFLGPDLIFSKGGHGSIAPVFAGRILFVPIFIHESDTVPGAANKFLNGFALEIFTSFPKTQHFPLKKMILVGNPIRRELMDGQKEEARFFFKTATQKPVLLILGGSQGAQRINEKILEALPQLLENFEIIHQCGEKNYSQVKSEVKIIISGEPEKSYHLFSFLKEPELKKAYVISDIILSRAGANSIFEIAAIGKPSILVPLPEAAQNHQVKNAYEYSENGACLVFEEENFTANFFLAKLKYLFFHTNELNLMAQKAKEFSRPEAGRIIASYIISYLTAK
ncbi:MAG: UDP-N-acetylglucosamine--N-acetylmuramyl-(pentapeptide) pyrophosphoryl-undecaprenol N-acetylglucosamine transferase [bacterium]|nr:UDP-N-acetylglucosamine--N-acetylmuramyl-(pentapeptide) pyrophosphoryl-undecaprenol N-acetylglucosamine transferase [bacterium]